MSLTQQVRFATPEDLDWIYRLRHRVYAEELRQHATQETGRLRDGLDGDNVYLVVAQGPTRIGFVSLTPPWVERYSLDKYLTRQDLPLLSEDDVVEVRILTVEPSWRRSGMAMVLMYAALRWAASRGGRTVVAMGRTDVLAMYQSVGLTPVGQAVDSGAVRFEVLTATVEALTGRAMGPFRAEIEGLLSGVEWHLDMSTWPRADGCEHGGASFTAIGTDFRTLHRRHEVVSADVLDAWFAPAPGVEAVLREDPGWAARTSPPSHAEGLQCEIAASRGLPEETLVLGAGSSDLIFRAFGRWLTAASRVLLIDPTYGEYAHITERVIGARVDRFRVTRRGDWRIDTVRLTETIRSTGYDLVVVVNPNNPTGRHTRAVDLRRAIENTPATTRWWIDEAYLGYVDLRESLAHVAAVDPRVAVCTSLSKMYALSGMRAAFVVTDPGNAAELRRWTPPWSISLPAQLAAVAALRDPDYYHSCWLGTHELRRALASELEVLGEGITVEEGVANFLNLALPLGGPSAAQFVSECRRHDVYLRDLSPLSTQYEGRTVRIAVQDASENARIVAACRATVKALASAGSGEAEVASQPRRD